MPINPAEEKRWRAEEDAHTLAEAQKVYKDPDRLKAAQAMAKEMAVREAEDAAAYRSVASRSTMPRAAANQPTGQGSSYGSGSKGTAVLPLKTLNKK